MKLDNEVLDNVAVNSNENTKWTTTEYVPRKMTELLLENVYTEEEMAFYDLNIPGDYSDYDTLDKEQ